MSRNRGAATMKPQPYTKVPCSTYGCVYRATVSIGKPDGPKNLFTHLCGECLESVVKSGIAQGFIKVDGSQNPPAGTGPAPTEISPEILNQSVGKLTESLKTICDPQVLSKLRAIESSSQEPRKTAIAAIEARIKVVAGSTEPQTAPGKGAKNAPAGGDPIE